MDDTLYCLGCGKLFHNQQGKASHQAFCDRYKNRAVSVSPSVAQRIVRNQPRVRVCRLDNAALRRVFAARGMISSREGSEERGGCGASSSSGAGSNVENDCNVDNVSGSKRVVVQLSKAGGGEDMAGSAKSLTPPDSPPPSMAKRKRRNEGEVCDEITLNQVRNWFLSVL